MPIRRRQCYRVDRAHDYKDAITGTALTLDYSVDAVGNAVALPAATASQARTYEYDALSRLKAVKDGSATTLEAFTYDGTGNRLSKQSGAMTQTYGYPATSHQLTSVAGTARTYDAMGSLTNRGDGWTFEYDARQRLASISQSGVVQQTNAYNGKGERVSRSTATGTQNYAYDEAGHLLTDYNQIGLASPSLQKEYIWLDDRPVAFRAVAGSHNGETLHVHSDHLGTPRAITRPSSSNALIWAWDLRGFAFGEHAADADSDSDGVALTLNLRYPGQYFDQETGLHYNYLRDYEPGTGRYVEGDPIGLLGGISSYSYVRADPLGLVDPLGLEGMGGWTYPPGPHRDQYERARSGRSCIDRPWQPSDPDKVRCLICKYKDNTSDLSAARSSGSLQNSLSARDAEHYLVACDLANSLGQGTSIVLTLMWEGGKVVRRLPPICSIWPTSPLGGLGSGLSGTRCAPVDCSGCCQ